MNKVIEDIQEEIVPETPNLGGTLKSDKNTPLPIPINFNSTP